MRLGGGWKYRCRYSNDVDGFKEMKESKQERKKSETESSNTHKNNNERGNKNIADIYLRQADSHLTNSERFRSHIETRVHHL